MARAFQAIVIGCSYGGLQALEKILSELPKGFPIPLAVVQHISPNPGGLLASLLGRTANLTVKEAEDKETVAPGTIYLAPPDYHLLIERGAAFSLSSDEKVNYSRPSIDVLFESAADAYGPGLMGVILTGANADGAIGLKRIKEQGGFTVVQDPRTAAASEMPRAAIEQTGPDLVIPLEEIGPFLASQKNNGDPS